MEDENSSGWVTTRQYDARDLLTCLEDPGHPAASVDPGVTQWTYDARALVTRRNNPDGTRTTTTYDGDRRILHRRHSKADNTRA